MVSEVRDTVPANTLTWTFTFLANLKALIPRLPHILYAKHILSKALKLMCWPALIYLPLKASS